MKKMKRIIRTIIIILFLIINTGYAQDITPLMLKNKGVLILAVGNDEALCVINTGYETGAYWFFIKGMTGNRANQPLGNNLSQLAEVHQLSASPDGKYLAVLSVGEGHPMVEVIDLQKLRDKNEYTALHVIDPYPGTIEIERWEGLKLMVASTVPLTLRKENGRVDPQLLLPEAKKFALNMPAGTIEAMNFDVK